MKPPGVLADLSRTVLPQSGADEAAASRRRASTPGAVHRIPELEALRGVMAMWVMLGHIWLALPGIGPGPINRILAHNGYAVEVFIILSGFVIFNLLDRTPETYRCYIARRICRIYPAYVVALAASMAMMPVTDVALADPFWHSARNDARLRILAATRENLGWHIAAHLPLLHGAIPARILPYAEYAILGQAWSISLEWQFYLVAPLLFAPLARGRPAVVSAILLACLAVHFKLRYFAGEAFLPAAIPNFAVGCASYFVWRERRRLATLPADTVSILVLAAGALAVLHASVPLAIWVIVFGALLANAAGAGSRPMRLLAAMLRIPAVTWLGTVSYSLYLVHMIPIHAAMAMMPAALRNNDTAAAAYLFLGSTLGTFLLAWLSFHFIERPGIAWGSALAARRRRLR